MPKTSTALLILRAMRPKQWTKNLFVFAGLVFLDGVRLADPALPLRAIGAFALFCLLSGAVYIFNDIRDAAQDRHHPVKRGRPIASGALGAGGARIWAAGLTLFSLLASFLWLGAEFGWVALIYFLINVLYTWALKHVVILDIFSIALGFALRAIAGLAAVRGIASEIEITSWFILCVFFLSLFLAICKRRHEAILLNEEGSRHRKALDEYSPAFLDQMVAVTTTSTILTYSLWTAQGKFADYHLELTVPFVVFGVFRYLYLVYRRDQGGEPEQALLRDAPLLACILLWAAAVLVLRYAW